MLFKHFQYNQYNLYGIPYKLYGKQCEIKNAHLGIFNSHP